MSHDSMRRRRVRSRISNAVLVAALSLAVGWVLVREPGTPAFSAGRWNASQEANASGSGYGRPEPPPRYALQEVADATVPNTEHTTDLHLRLLFPTTAGKLAVIIFSPADHGWPECCDTLLRNWASHGYFVVQIVSSSAARPANPPATSLQAATLKRATRRRANFAPPATRPQDISAVIDSLAAIQARFLAPGQKIDAARIGVAGQGSGAAAVEAIAGALLDGSEQGGGNLADPRVRAVLCVSPQGPGRFGLTEHSFDSLTLPYLGVTGGRDAAPAKFAAVEWHRAPFDRSQPGDKYQLSVQGEEDHSSGAAGSDPTPTQIEVISRAFWDAYLKHDLTARRYLESDWEKKKLGGLKFEQR